MHSQVKKPWQWVVVKNHLIIIPLAIFSNIMKFPPIKRKSCNSFYLLVLDSIKKKGGRRWELSFLSFWHWNWTNLTASCVLQNITNLQEIWLAAHNWQKWKSTFLTCPCHKIYRVEAVGLSIANYTLKIMIFVEMWNLGQFEKFENLIFCQ